ncbi:hypothetical protein QJS04_geneDACA009408 [Acorus gramineus]|uniref:GTD-binding domain-containing protein n=1 Tax=Acorus gramineus TaxID=55184 RepID=A0AAV9AFP3_ACOGR|nr:hypothetical protein QJS04_geneDACA009408 [Acorus gramineus]
MDSEFPPLPPAPPPNQCTRNCCCSPPRQTDRSVKRKLDEDALRFHQPPSVARVEAEDEVSALREAVTRQQQTIQDLYAELDEERSAASTAANEAMSMILRLQREKAEALMDARQFRRYAEEKMAHDQQELLALEDLLYKREQAIHSLSCEIQAYKHRMMSFGVTEIEAEDCGTDSGDEEASSVDRVCTVDLVEEPLKPAMVVCEEEAVRGEGGGGGVGEEEIKKLYMRLQALEADRESMKQVIVSMRTDKAQLILLREIAQQLCRDMPEKQRVVKRPSRVGGFSLVALFKWIGSFILWRKKSQRSKYMFGTSNNNVGLLLLLERSPRVKQWRCITRRQG